MPLLWHFRLHCSEPAVVKSGLLVRRKWEMKTCIIHPYNAPPLFPPPSPAAAVLCSLHLPPNPPLADPEALPSGSRPLLVFVNLKSGPQAGASIKRQLLQLLHPLQVKGGGEGRGEEGGGAVGPLQGVQRG